MNTPPSLATARESEGENSGLFGRRRNTLVERLHARLASDDPGKGWLRPRVQVPCQYGQRASQRSVLPEDRPSLSARASIDLRESADSPRVVLLRCVLRPTESNSDSDLTVHNSSCAATRHRGIPQLAQETPCRTPRKSVSFTASGTRPIRHHLRRRPELSIPVSLVELTRTTGGTRPAALEAG